MVSGDDAGPSAERPDPPRGGGLRFHLVRWLPLALVAALVYVLFPPPAHVAIPDYAVGEIPDRTIRAPFAYVVRKSPEELAREGDARAALAQPVYRYSPTAYDSAVGALRTYFARLQRADSLDPYAARAELEQGTPRLAPDEVEYLLDPARRRQLRDALLDFLSLNLSRGVADPGVIRAEPSPRVNLRRGDGERVLPRDSIVTFVDLLERAEQVTLPGGSDAGVRVFRRLVAEFYRPTIVPDPTETTTRRERLRQSVDSVRYTVRSGDVLVADGQPVTEDARAKLTGLAAELERRGGGVAEDRALLGAILYNALMLSVFWIVLMFYQRRTYAQIREVLFFATLFALVVLMTAGINAVFPSRPELVPIAFATLMATMLYGGRVGLLAGVTLAILLGEQWPLRESHTLFFGVVSGVSGAVGVRIVRRRRHLYRTIVVLTVGNALAALTLGFMLGWSKQAIVESAILGGLVALGSASVAMLLLPLAESATRITTDLTLLELSDLGRPLLRRLAVEAPGTWAHSLAMANLCESACNLIGANGLLARVGCYYHDIGKLANPQYFVENQGGGPNPHDRLDPHESALIIRDHVRDGIALAEAAKLPAVVRNFIPEHHGTSNITYFLNRARSLSVGPVDLRDFRYPGPRPRSVETAVAMLADSCEAAIRVLPEHTPATVAAAIEQVVEQKLASGQLDDAPMTLRDLDRIKREFARVMSGTYHKRVSQPRVIGGAVPELEPARHD